VWSRPTRALARLPIWKITKANRVLGGLSLYSKLLGKLRLGGSQLQGKMWDPIQNKHSKKG
jgi:hypothetical protein